MFLIGCTDEDFVNYKKPSMFISTPYCTFKCEKDCGIKCCQNSDLVKQHKVFIENELLIKRYLHNPITKSIVFGGLEPFDSFEEVYAVIRTLRYKYNRDDDVVIYTGYNENEIEAKIKLLKDFKNIIVKFGRFIPDRQKHFDEVLGVYLASENQYAQKIS